MQTYKDKWIQVKKTAEELLEAGDITKEQYDSWVDWNEKEKKKEKERRNPQGNTG